VRAARHARATEAAANLETVRHKAESSRVLVT
jgi:hypothetical protein